jgi:hypothetical protein
VIARYEKEEMPERYSTSSSYKSNIKIHIRPRWADGVAENVAMKISGHQTRAVFDRYDIISGKDLIDAAAKMEDRLNQRMGTIPGTLTQNDSEQDELLKRRTAEKELQ